MNKKILLWIFGLILLVSNVFAYETVFDYALDSGWTGNTGLGKHPYGIFINVTGEDIKINNVSLAHSNAATLPNPDKCAVMTTDGNGVLTGNITTDVTIDLVNYYVVFNDPPTLTFGNEYAIGCWNGSVNRMNYKNIGGWPHSDPKIFLWDALDSGTYRGQNYAFMIHAVGYTNITTPPPVIPSDLLNISQSSIANNTQYDHKIVSLNLSINATNSINCSLNVSGVLNETKYSSAGDNLLINWTKTWADGLNDYKIHCVQANDSTIFKNTSTKYFYIDSVDPAIASTSLDGNNTYWTGTLSMDINAGDSYLSSLNFNTSCNFGVYNSTATNPHNSTYNFNITGCTVGQQFANVTVCDAPNGTVLNCLTENYLFNSMARLNITAIDYEGTTIKFFDIYKNGTLAGSTSNGYLHLDNLSLGVYNITFNNATYELLNATINVTSSYQAYEFNPYSTNSFNFTFLNEENNTIIKGIAIDVEFISDLKNYNYTTKDGTLYVDLIYPMTYTIRYKSNQSVVTKYHPNHFIYTLTNRTHNELSLYMNNYSTEITTNVYNSVTLNTIEGAIIYLQKRFEDGTYSTIAMGETDPSGKSYFYTQDDEYYKFLVDYPFGTRRLSTDKFYIKSNSINLYIDLQAQVAETFFDEQSISSTLVYDSSSREFDVTWSDTAAVATQFCLYVKQYGYYGKTIINSSCSSSSSGSIALALPEENATYYAVFTGEIDGDERTIRTGFIELLSDSLSAGSMGIFMTIILIITFTFIGAFHILALILANAGLILAKSLSLINLGWGYIIVISLASLILGIIISLRR